MYNYVYVLASIHVGARACTHTGAHTHTHTHTQMSAQMAVGMCRYTENLRKRQTALSCQIRVHVLFLLRKKEREKGHFKPDYLSLIHI